MSDFDSVNVEPLERDWSYDIGHNLEAEHSVDQAFDCSESLPEAVRSVYG